MLAIAKNVVVALRLRLEIRRATCLLRGRVNHFNLRLLRVLMCSNFLMVTTDVLDVLREDTRCVGRREDRVDVAALLRHFEDGVQAGREIVDYNGTMN